MGDRANIYMVQNDGKDAGLYFYTHWSGSELPETLQLALKQGKDRWNDEQYLGRIIFCTMVGSDKGNTGFGITTYLCDGGYKLLVVNAEKQTVGVSASWDSIEVVKSWTFDEYVALDFSKQSWSVLTDDDD